MKKKSLNKFDSIGIRVASPKDILNWSNGEVLNPETINYRTQNFEKDGLFAENIFGPSKDYQCSCGKYKHRRYKGIVCEKCGVEVTTSRVRRERMGHIKLVSPVAHIWFWRKNPSRIGLLLNKTSNELEKVIYFASYMVTHIDEKARKKAVKKAKKEKEDKEIIKKLRSLEKLQIISELDYRDLAFKFGHVFKASIGAEAVTQALERLDLEQLISRLSEQKKKKPDDKKIKQALVLAKSLLKNNIKPEWMCLTVIPVVPPELRPMVELEGGRFASSDLNDLYRRIINRNNRLKKLLDLGAPEIICRNEKRMLQEAVDALIDNSARSKQTQVASSTGQNRALRSLSDMLKGKKGRFRRNLLGKRVDYSGRSVIVAGPHLQMHQCGLPKKMALELFKPFVINRILEHELAHNIRAASLLIEQQSDEIFDLLQEAIEGKYILLNRAPTLHRLGIQAFQPVLIEGKAIQLHPLVCAAFNADFDGDQMAVHLPLSKKAQEEAREIIAAQKNALAPANGGPIANPEKDMVLGVYYITKLNTSHNKAKQKVRFYYNTPKQAILAYNADIIGLRDKIWVKKDSFERTIKENSFFVETSVGRIIFNQALPIEIPFVNELVPKGKLKKIVGQIFHYYNSEQAAVYLDKIKNLGFHYATLSGLSWAMDDLQVSPKKPGLVAKSTKKVKKIEKFYNDGLLTPQERHQQITAAWAELKTQLGELVKQELDRNGAVYSMVDSKARGSWELVTQMSGMKGLVVNPSGKIIELPIKSSFKEGFGVLEYFLASHGTRKGMADTALRTASAGYLTRRLVDVAQDVIITCLDCGTKDSITIFKKDCDNIGQGMASRLFGRVAAETIPNIIKKGQAINHEKADLIEEKGLEKVKVFSPVTCQAKRGLCQKCFGYDLGRNNLVELGQAVGVVTAQAIGEPGTQLTLRTFHSGGVVGTDITQGLPRVEEIFEVRNPKGKAVIAKEDCTVKRIRQEKGQDIVSVDIDNKKIAVREYTIPKGHTVLVKEKQKLSAGDMICQGSIDLEELFKTKGKLGVTRYVVNEIQKIYSGEGAVISDKYIEVIVRKMLSQIKITKSGDTNLLVGQTVERSQLEEINKELKKNEKPAQGKSVLLGITKVSLDRESWLSAASFQETPRVLIEASTLGKKDKLRGLKENVIIGRLIPLLITNH